MKPFTEKNLFVVLLCFILFYFFFLISGTSFLICLHEQQHRNINSEFGTDSVMVWDSWDSAHTEALNSFPTIASEREANRLHTINDAIGYHIIGLFWLLCSFVFFVSFFLVIMVAWGKGELI